MGWSQVKSFWNFGDMYDLDQPQLFKTSEEAEKWIKSTIPTLEAYNNYWEKEKENYQLHDKKYKAKLEAFSKQII